MIFSGGVQQGGQLGVAGLGLVGGPQHPAVSLIVGQQGAGELGNAPPQPTASPGSQLQNLLGPSPLGPTDSLTTLPQRSAKEWHQSVTQDLRNHLVHKL